MLKVFKKKINPLHSLRDYEDQFSSKNDVLSPLSESGPLVQKSPTTLAKHFSTTKGNGSLWGAKSMNKNNNTTFVDKQDSENMDDLDSSFRKRKAEFHYHKKTFIFCKRSLYIFDESNKLRRFAVWLTEHRFFELATIALILFNAVLLGLRDFTDNDKKTNANKIYDYTAPIFIVYYLVEAALKIIARGFMNESNSYLRAGWNWVDLFVAVSGIFYFEDALTYYSILRILKVLHILRPFKKFKSMDDMLSVIDSSFWALVSILGLLIFFMGLFSILGLNLYSGILDFRCRTTPVPVGGVWPIASDSNRICGYTYKCPASDYCGSSFEVSAHITDSSDDIFLPNLNYGLTDFDNFGDALFSVFIIINGNWANIMQMISDADNNYVALIYLFLTYIICKFFIIQLGVAVMLDNFTKIKEKENPKKYLSVNQTTRLEELQSKPDLNSEKITGFHERWRYFTNKHFPSVHVPNDDYYKNPFSYYAYKFTAHGSFKYLTILLAIINIVVVGLDRYPLSDTQENILDIFNKVLTILYLLEVFLRITAVSAHRYLQENFNKFEFIVAILCLIELIGVKDLRAINILRVFRVMRYMKRDYTWDNFKVLITVVFQAFTYIIDYIILLGIYMYIFAVLGMKYFAGKFKFNDDGHVDLINGSIPRENFDTLYEAYTVVFQMLVGEDVLGVVLAAIRATSWLSTIYFIVLIVTGKYVLIQLFLAITLGNFEEARVQVNYGYLTSRFIIFKMFKRKKTKKVRSLASFTNIGQIGEKSLSNILDLPSRKNENEPRSIIKPQKVRNELDEEIENRKNDLLSDENRENSTRKPLVRHGLQRQFTRQPTYNNHDMFHRAMTKVYPENGSVDKGTKQFDDIETKLTKLQKLYRIFKQMKKSSLCIFHKDSWIRKNANAIVSNPVWDTGMLICIILSSILLILDNPLDDPESKKSKIYDTINKVFTLLFVIEMILKIIASGFLFNYKDNQKAYIRNEWNILDCVVAVTSTIDVLSGGGNSGLKSLKALRSIRALRPLRVISRNEDLKLIVNALFRTFPSLINLMVVAGLIMVIGATIGTGLFKGEFHYCATGSGGTPTSFAKIITKNDCLTAGGIWLNSDTNYDNFLEAMLTYFKMIIGTDWLGAVYSGVDAVGIDMQPKSWSNYGTIFYFYIFLMIGNVLIRNLFVGVVIDNFRQMKEELGGFLLLNEMQRDWVEMQIFMQRKKLRQIIPEPENSFRKKCFDIAQHHRFTYFVIFIIACNTMILGIKYRTETGDFEHIIDVLNKAFLVVFHIEALFNIIALGKFYFKDMWNQFDLLILLITDVVLILSLVFDNVNIYTIPTVIRALRLGRIVKFIRASKHIRILIDTIFFLLPSLTNIAALLFLMMFIYAVLGMNLFATTKMQIYINDYANFQDLWSSLNILARSALGQDWSLFMRELADRTILGCVNDQSFDDMESDGILGCGTYLAYPYFISYVCIVTLILTNLFLAVVVGGYIESKKENEAVISPTQMDEFLEKWAEYDPQGTGLISPEQFAFLIHDLPQPLGLKDNASVRYEYDLTAKKNKGYLISENKKIVLKRVQLFRDMSRFDVPVYNCKVHFSDACKIISYNAVIKIYKTDPKGESEAHSPEIKVSDEKLEEQLREKLKIKSDYVNRTLAKGWSNKYSILRKLQKNPKGLHPVLVTSFYAGKYILGFWKKWRDEKKTYELQLAEKKGVDYDKTFEYQKRLANAQMVQKQLKSIKKGKATRNYDKKKTKRTHPSVNSMTGFSKTQQDDISRQSSLAHAEDAQIPLGSDGSYNSVVSEEEYKSSVLSKGNFEKLIEYKNSSAKTPIKRRTSTVSNFAQFRTFQNNEFWLQPVSNTEKFPVPVTVEIDRFMLNYLEQPEIISSRSTATVQDEKDDSEESETLGGDSSEQTSSNNSSFTSSEEEEEEKAEENNQEQEERRSPPNFKITEFDEEPKEQEQIHQEENNINVQPEDEEEAEDHLRTPFERKTSNDSDKPRGLLDSAKADLETINEEEGEANTRADLDSRDIGKRRTVKPGTVVNGKSYSQFRKKQSYEDEADKPTSIAIGSQNDALALALKTSIPSNASVAASINQIKKEDAAVSDEKLLQDESAV